MFLSERATIHAAGLNLPSDAVRRLGIGRRADCWGLWLPYWNADLPRGKASDQSMPDHFAVSPIHPDAWPCLLHVTLKLRDESGTVLRAVSHLHAFGLDILSYVFAQTGHNHGTLTAVATVPKLLDDQFIKDARKAASKGSVLSMEDVTTSWAEPVLNYIKDLEEWLINRNKSKNKKVGDFLRPRFLRSSSTDDSHGLAFDPKFLSRQLRAWEAKRQHFVDAVSIRWLQYPAYYWLRCCDPSPIRLRVDASGTGLSPDEAYRNDYRLGLHIDLINNDRLLHPALVSIEPASRIIRVMPMRSNGGVPLRVVVRQEYKRRSPADPRQPRSARSRGVLKLLVEAIHEHSGNLWHMSNEVVRLGEESDCSHIKFIVTDARLNNKGTDGELRELLYRGIASVNPQARGLPDVFVSKPAITHFDALRVFISKNHDWWTKNKLGKRVRSKLRKLLPSCGYAMEENPTTGPFRSPDIRSTIHKQLRRCHGFILFIPMRYRNWESRLQWLEYELGFARGRGLASEIVVERTKNGRQAQLLDERFKTNKGSEYWFIDESNVEAELKKIVNALSDQIRRGGSLH